MKNEDGKHKIRARVTDDNGIEEIKDIPIDMIERDPDLTPNIDERFIELYMSAIVGKSPVFFAEIPLSLCVPFDIDYRPDKHPVGAEAIQREINRSRTKHSTPMIVYPRGIWFMVCDDYIQLFAALQELPTYVPCFILGEPDNPLINVLKGPLTQEEVNHAIGL